MGGREQAPELRFWCEYERELYQLTIERPDLLEATVMAMCDGEPERLAEIGENGCGSMQFLAPVSWTSDMSELSFSKGPVQPTPQHIFKVPHLQTTAIPLCSSPASPAHQTGKNFEKDGECCAVDVWQVLEEEFEYEGIEA